MNRHEREQFFRFQGFQNVPAIVGALEKENVLPYRAGALVLNESSGGYNVYGREGATPELYGAAVTEENYKTLYVPRRATEGLNGVGPTQITALTFQDEADALGGAWDAYYNCCVGFHNFHELVSSQGEPWAAFAAYNGGAGWRDDPPDVRARVEDYANKAIAHSRTLMHAGLR